ncbi:hypothetical protein DFH09DRAFT_156301 [Mycena vulgaris]|nr:hypothetical protein DFH09DRAFT_156301 [Mycena vulgaris]
MKAEMVSMLVIMLLLATYLDDFVILGPHYARPVFLIIRLSSAPCDVLDVHPDRLQVQQILQTDKSIEMPVITLFLRDGIMRFIVVFGVDGTQMLIWARGRATLTQVLIISCLVYALWKLTLKPRKEPRGETPEIVTQREVGTLRGIQ